VAGISGEGYSIRKSEMLASSLDWLAIHEGSLTVVVRVRYFFKSRLTTIYFCSLFPSSPVHAVAKMMMEMGTIVMDVTHSFASRHSHDSHNSHNSHDSHDSLTVGKRILLPGRTT
jgi:hypothetical protein